MPQSRIATLQLKLDDWRVRQHFKRVERILRGRDVSHLSPELQQARHQHLDHLHTYAQRGIFPRNHEHPIYAPCFIDRDQRECAVAHLMMTSGHTNAAHKIATVANYAFVPQMNVPELDDWASGTGFSRDELALIQPGYYLALNGPFLWIAIAIWATGLATALINGFQIARKRIEIGFPRLGIVIAILLLLLSIICLLNLPNINEIATNPDEGQAFMSLAREDMNNLVVGVVISLVIALLAGGLGYYRWQTYLASKWSAKQTTSAATNNPPQ